MLAINLRRALVAGTLLGLTGLFSSASPAGDDDHAFLPRLVNSSTIPENGDTNPYGVAFVPDDFPQGGPLKSGDVLVSNFNNVMGLQGSGTTIIALDPHGPIAFPVPPGMGTATVFFTSPQPGLSTALGVLRFGLVIVGNVPTTDGTFGTIGAGALQVIDHHGHLLQTLTDAKFLDGPWDLALDDQGDKAHIFISNVLSGTVSRFDVTVGAKGLTGISKTLIATGYSHEPNSSALVTGPTGLAFDADKDILYVASTQDNAIYAIEHAKSATGPVNRGNLIFADSHLHGPLALRFAPNGHLLTANGDAVNIDTEHPSEIVEFTRYGEFVREYNLDASLGGAFGIDTRNGHHGFNYAAVDDVTNNLTVYELPIE
jgi:hypothetical protein